MVLASWWDQVAPGFYIVLGAALSFGGAWVMERARAKRDKEDRRRIDKRQALLELEQAVQEYVAAESELCSRLLSASDHQRATMLPGQLITNDESRRHLARAERMLILATRVEDHGRLLSLVLELHDGRSAITIFDWQELNLEVDRELAAKGLIEEDPLQRAAQVGFEAQLWIAALLREERY
jgi:hypothetical protein